MIRLYNEQIPGYAKCDACRHRIGAEMDTSCWYQKLPNGKDVFTCEDCKLEYDLALDEAANKEREHCAGGCSQCLWVP